MPFQSKRNVAGNPIKFAKKDLFFSSFEATGDTEIILLQVNKVRKEWSGSGWRFKFKAFPCMDHGIRIN